MRDTATALVQARMGATRLPGKVMLPLGCKYELESVVARLMSSHNITDVVICTTKNRSDDIIAWCAEQLSVSVYRGQEDNVLTRLYRAAEMVEADEIVRITADCPLINPDIIDKVISRRRETGADYAANILKRTFPRGLDVEVFTRDSFEHVHKQSTTPAEKEHVTLYYRQNPEEFERVNVTSDEVFDEDFLQNRTDLRLTLDELDDYRLLKKVFDDLDYDRTPDFKEAVRYIDRNNLSEINASVEQKSLDNASGNSS